MECLKFFKRKMLVKERTTVCRINKICGKLTRAVYAGLIVCFVPSVLCQGWSRRLTYDEIYNDTNYVQLQQRPRPYDITEYSYEVTHVTPDKNVNSYRNNEINTEVTTSAVLNRYTNSLEEIAGNEIDSDVNDYGRIREPLLVGFSHDPFRYSVPEEDYLKGVRDMTPKSIMSKGENRGKRGVLHLYNMMYCATGCEPLSYKGYGCYCGFLGSGRPTDGIDRCCKIHDECYENIYCPFYTVYFQPYYWKCYKGQPLCALENYHTEHQFINGCAARLCECDRRFAMCVKRYKCPRRRALCRSSPLRLLQNLFMLP